MKLYKNCNLINVELNKKLGRISNRGETKNQPDSYPKF